MSSGGPGAATAAGAADADIDAAADALPDTEVPGIAPAVTPESAPFWQAAARGELLVERCEDCTALNHPPHGICRVCHSRRIGHARIHGPGRVYSFTVNHQRWMPGLEVPFILVWVEFPDEAPGVRVVGRLRGAEPDEVRVGMTVAVGFEPGPGGQAVPSFLAAADSGVADSGVADSGVADSGEAAP